MSTLSLPIARSPMRPRRVFIVLLSLGLAVLGAFFAALAAGEVAAGPRAVLDALLGRAGGIESAVVAQLRLPRALAAFGCGGLLALAGALMQVLLRNPLADPYVLGISGGASVGALSAMLLGLATPWVDGAALAGALATMFAVFGLSRGSGSWTHTRLLLTGVVVASGCGAVVSLLLTLSPDRALRGMLFWMMGDAGAADRPGLILAVLALGLLATLPMARELNLLARGERHARALGVNTHRLATAVFLLGSLLTAAAVTSVGAVGFVGLVVPHLLRMVVGNDQRLLLPAAALGGGGLLLVADTAARTVVAPLQLPVGVLTALIGVPVFLWLLSRHPR
ncbi:iron ABC transporter permease [Niveibacterium umoris]|uniref:Iron complex transport system permease protein n=1 Tax=Niveibacterium umoris TaxID=1193620 RepID=A0A840BP27_9RHOO|nr:iron ABC transporter permease [Niveibacterium umoris]MBB4014354.1 iron complex transport system permease protein [Niveibacterium umoris]